jgi:hypothetical protein
VEHAAQLSLTMSSRARAAKLADIEAELLACEREEEALIEHGEEQGTPVSRRLDCDPRAVLGIVLARSKNLKRERIRAAS